MQSQKAPQIIVIPHNLLQQQKSLLKISPSQAPISPYRVITTAQPTLNRTILSSSMNNSSHLTLNRAVLSPSLPIPSLRTVQPSVVRPVAAVVGSKRPAPSFSPTFGGELIKLEVDGEDESQPIRKRANLDHLSQEERLMRRKLKNRVAAQTARDKKKAQTDDMEKLISQMKEEQNSVLEANERLQAVNNQLQVENAALQRENTQLKSRMGPTTVGLRTDNVLELDLPPSPVSLPPTSPHPHSSLLSPTLSISSPLLASASPTLQPSESAELTYDPQQQEQGCRCWGKSRKSSQSLPPPPGLSSKDLTPWVDRTRGGRGDCLAVVLCALWCLIRANQFSSSLPQTSYHTLSTPTSLPPKKRDRSKLLSWTLDTSLTPQPPE